MVVCCNSIIPAEAFVSQSSLYQMHRMYIVTHKTDARITFVNLSGAMRLLLKISKILHIKTPIRSLKIGIFP